MIRSLLVIAHGHPRIHIGGGEQIAYEEFQEFQQDGRRLRCAYLFPLADTLVRVADRELWERLRSNLPNIRPVRAHWDELLKAYERVSQSR